MGGRRRCAGLGDWLSAEGVDLIPNINIVVRDVATGRRVAAGSVDIRLASGTAP